MRRWGAALAGAMVLTGCENQFVFGSDFGNLGEALPPDLAVPTQEDVITQVTKPETDILWVIDNSGSMAEEQAKLAKSFPKFIQFFIDSGLDWHIGVVSTDTDGNNAGKLQQAGAYRYLEPDLGDEDQITKLFKNMATLGTNGSSEERGRRAAYRALTDPLKSGYNAGFYRDNASLHIITISDENDQSVGDPSRNEWITFLNTLKEDPEMVTSSSIVGPAQGCSGNGGLADPGTEYIAVTQAVGGIFESICADDWDSVLEQLGLQASTYKKEYFLSEVPVADTVEVWVQEGDYIYEGINVANIPAGKTPADLCETACFTYEYKDKRNSILMLDFVPKELAEIHIRYELLSGWSIEQTE